MNEFQAQYVTVGTSWQVMVNSSFLFLCRDQIVLEKTKQMTVLVLKPGPVRTIATS